MKKIYSYFLLAFFGIMSSQAQNSITSVDQTYSQDFNTLADTGSAQPLALPNWAISTETYRVSDGSVNSGTVYSFGAAESTERALGAVTSGSFPNISFGTSFFNETGVNIGTIEISYTGEQWRRSNKTLGGVPVGDTLVFQYSTNASSITDENATWNTVNNLEFVSPNIFDGTSNGTKLDGNLAENSKVITGSFDAFVGVGKTIFIRWNYIRKTGNGLNGSRDGIGIDDLTVSFKEGGEEPVDNCDYVWEEFVEVLDLNFNQDSIVYIEFSEIEGADGYIVLLDLNPLDESYEYGEPVNGEQYAVGDYINESLVVSVSSSTKVLIPQIVDGNYYQIYIQPYYICEGQYEYGDYNGAEIDLREVDVCENPLEIAPEEINVEVNGSSISFEITPVDGAIGYIVFVDNADEADEAGDDYDWGWPEDGETYTSGQSLGQSLVAYVGVSNTGIINDLDENTYYYISAHPIFDCDGNAYGWFAENEFETSVATSVKNIQTSELSIYPNPVSGNVINVRLDAVANGKANIQIFNVLGAQVYSAQTEISNENRISLPGKLAAGRYSIRIQQDGSAQVGSFIVVE